MAWWSAKRAVGTKTNGLTAIRQLRGTLKLKGRVVTIDALSCQTDIAETIADADGWYLRLSRITNPNCTATCAATSPTSTAPAAQPQPTTRERP